MKDGALGRRGERRVRLYLRLRGYRIAAMNYAVRGGEIDIVAQRGNYLCFVEVKTRTADSMGSPAEYVTPQKQKRIIRAAYSYICKIGTDKMPRFDVAEVIKSGRRMRVRYYTDAFCVDEQNNPSYTVK